MKPSELIEALDLLVEARIPTCIEGEAGVGKSDIVRQVTAARGKRLIDVRAVLLDPVDIKGLPHVNGDGRAHWATPDFLPRDGEGTLFLDELNRAPQLVQNACLQLALDRRVGDYELPDGWSVVAAINPDTHRGTVRMSEALANRFEHLTLETDVDDWTAWALNADIEPELIAFIRFRPELLHSYDRNSTEKAYPSPRTWGRNVNPILKAKPSPHIEAALFNGAIGSGPGAEFTGFLSMYRQLPSIDGILMNPKTADVPKDPAPLFAIAAALARRASDTNMDRVIEYVNRMPKEWGAYCVKDAAARDAMVQHTKAFQRWASDNKDIMG